MSDITIHKTQNRAFDKFTRSDRTVSWDIIKPANIAICRIESSSQLTLTSHSQHLCLRFVIGYPLRDVIGRQMVSSAVKRGDPFHVRGDFFLLGNGQRGRTLTSRDHGGS